MKQMKCFICGEEGHIGRDCSKCKVTPQVGYQGKITCYNCGQPEHISREYPKRKKVEQPNRGAQNVHHGRVYNLTRKDVEANPIIIEGTLFFFVTLIHALTDPRSIRISLFHVHQHIV